MAATDVFFDVMQSNLAEFTNVSDKLAACIFRIGESSFRRSKRVLREVGEFLPKYTRPQCRDIRVCLIFYITDLM
jgi:hypothetical protein